MHVYIYIYIYTHDAYICIYIVESGMTHSGKAKELLFEKHRDDFEPFLDKIVHVVLDTLPGACIH